MQLKDLIQTKINRKELVSNSEKRKQKMERRARVNLNESKMAEQKKEARRQRQASLRNRRAASV